MKIFLTERQNQVLIKSAICKKLHEEVVYMGEKENLVLDWLNKHFKKIQIQGTNNLNLPTISFAIVATDPYGQPTKQMKQIEDVFYILQANFKKILGNRNDRDKFLHDTLLKWYNNQ